MEASSSATVARQTWELENNIQMESPAGAVADADAMYQYDEVAQAGIQQQKPWVDVPHYFKNVKISALALLKMVVHARSGGTIEVMGLMQGKTDGDTIIIMVRHYELSTCFWRSCFVSVRAVHNISASRTEFSFQKVEEK